MPFSKWIENIIKNNSRNNYSIKMDILFKLQNNCTIWEAFMEQKFVRQVAYVSLTSFKDSCYMTFFWVSQTFRVFN